LPVVDEHTPEKKNKCIYVYALILFYAITQNSYMYTQNSTFRTTPFNNRTNGNAILAIAIS
jgi:hypothetical protein